MIRVTLDIRTNLDPGTLYLLIWQLILKAHPFRDVVLVAGSAETVEGSLADQAFNDGVEAVCALTDEYRQDIHCPGHDDDPCCHVRTALSLGEKGRALKKSPAVVRPGEVEW